MGDTDRITRIYPLTDLHELDSSERIRLGSYIWNARFRQLLWLIRELWLFKLGSPQVIFSLRNLVFNHCSNSGRSGMLLIAFSLAANRCRKIVIWHHIVISTHHSKCIPSRVLAARLQILFVWSWGRVGIGVWNHKVGIFCDRSRGCIIKGCVTWNLSTGEEIFHRVFNRVLQFSFDSLQFFQDLFG